MAATQILGSGIRALSAGGSGTPIVLVPGWPQTAEAFLPLVPLLSTDYRVFILDPPGLGDSHPPPGDDYTTATVSRILHEAITSVVKEPFHLVGHDIGAWIVYSWASQFPSSILTLSLLDSSVPGLAKKLPYPLPAPLNVKLWQFSFNALPELPEILTQGRERPLLDWLFDRKSVHPERITRETRDLYVQYYSKCGAMSRGFAYYRAVAASAEQNVTFAQTKGRLAMPLLTLGGSAAVGDGLRGTMEDYAEKVDGKVIEDCGHYIMEEQPQSVARYLRDFLSTHEAPR